MNSVFVTEIPNASYDDVRCSKHKVVPTSKVTCKNYKMIRLMVAQRLLYIIK